MSEPTSRSQPPEKPAWLQRPKANVADGSGESPASREPVAAASKSVESPSAAIQTSSKRPTNPAGRKRPAKSPERIEPRSPLPLSVRVLRFVIGGSMELGTVPADLSASQLLRLWWKSNRTGFLASLGLHALLLVVFAIWALPQVITPKNFVLDGFSTIGPAGDSGPEGPIQINAKITPVDLPSGRGTSKTASDSTEITLEKSLDSPGSGTVKPVDVGGALAGRGSGDGGAGGGGSGGGGGKGGIWQGLGVGTKPPTGIAAGLAWLVRQQEKGGNWKLHEGYPDAGERVIRTDAGATALALLALLGDGNTTIEGPHAKAVAKGVAYLKSIQKANGDYHDHEELGRQTAFYAHSQATIAMCEAYALTREASLKSSCERAVRFLLDSQHPQNGGWRYQPQSGESMGDLSVTGWALMALHSARIAKLSVPFDNFERASLFLESVSEQNGARYKYQPNDPLEKVSPAMTAEGLLCRQWLGWPKDHPSQTDALKYLLSEENKPSWAPGRRNVYAWYYTAQVLHNVGGPEWQAWYQHTSELILKGQVSGGGEVGGSWHPTKPPGSNEEYATKAGRLYLTAMCLLVLETPIRHAAIYEPTKTVMKNEK